MQNSYHRPTVLQRKLHVSRHAAHMDRNSIASSIPKEGESHSAATENCPGNEVGKTPVPAGCGPLMSDNLVNEATSKNCGMSDKTRDAGGHLNVPTRWLPCGVLLPKILDRHLCLASAAEVRRPSALSDVVAVWANESGLMSAIR